MPMNESHKKALKGVRAKIWTLYRALKSYKLSPWPKQAKALWHIINVFEHTTKNVLERNFVFAVPMVLIARLGTIRHLALSIYLKAAAIVVI
jgi:hypothetical protein